MNIKTCISELVQHNVPFFHSQEKKKEKLEEKIIITEFINKIAKEKNKFSSDLQIPMKSVGLISLFYQNIYIFFLF